MTSTSAVMLCLPQKSSISCVSATPPDKRVRNATTLEQEAEGLDGMRLVGCADEGDVAVAAE